MPYRLATSHGVDSGNRTRISSLEGWRSTVELYLHIPDGFDMVLPNGNQMNSEGGIDRRLSAAGGARLPSLMGIGSSAADNRRLILLSEIIGKDT